MGLRSILYDRRKKHLKSKSTIQHVQNKCPSSPRFLDPVVKAIKTDAVDSLREMVKRGTPLTERNKLGWLPLHEAAVHGTKECLDILLKGKHPSFSISNLFRRRSIARFMFMFLKTFKL